MLRALVGAVTLGTAVSAGAMRTGCGLAFKVSMASSLANEKRGQTRRACDRQNNRAVIVGQSMSLPEQTRSAGAAPYFSKQHKHHGKSYM